MRIYVSIVFVSEPEGVSDIKCIILVFTSTNRCYVSETKIQTHLNLNAHPTPEAYIWKVGTGSKISEISNLTGQNSKSAEYLKPGQVLQRLFSTLTEDFYRPKRLSELFEKVFPNEYYFPDSSTLKMYQACKRLRQFFSLSKVPLLLYESSGLYSLRAQNGNQVNILCSLLEDNSHGIQQEDIIKLDRFFGTLKESLKKKAFTRKDIVGILKVSDRTALYLVEGGIKLKKIIKVGKGPSTKYIFSTN